MKRIMKNLLLVLGICVLAATASAVVPEPSLSWNFDRPDLFDILPVHGKCLGHLHRNSRYEFVSGFSGKALKLGMTPKIGGVWFEEFPLDFTKAFTISVKMKLTPQFFSPVRFRKHTEIWGNSEAAGPGIRLYLYQSNLFFSTGDGLRLTALRIPTYRYRVPIERWFQAVVTYDGMKVTVYLDGKACGVKEMKITASRKPFNVGSMQGLRNPIQGLVDDLEIYDKALSPEQVRDITLKKKD